MIQDALGIESDDVVNYCFPTIWPGTGDRERGKPLGLLAAQRRAIGGDVSESPGMPQPANGQAFGSHLGEVELSQARGTALPVVPPAPLRRQGLRLSPFLHRHDAANRCSSTAIGLSGFGSQRTCHPSCSGLANGPAGAFRQSARSHRFGNLGLAAASYNAGPNRVSQWLAGKRDFTDRDPQLRRHYHRLDRGRMGVQFTAADGRNHIPQGVPFANLVLAPKEEAKRIATYIPRWGIWLAAHLVESKAWAMYRDRLKRFASLIGDREPIVLQRQSGYPTNSLIRWETSRNNARTDDQLVPATWRRTHLRSDC